MAGIDLTARAKKYSLYIPSMQINSAEKVCMTADKWQDSPLPCGLEPKDFNFLDPNNKFWTYLYALASAEKFKDSENNAITRRDPSCFITGDSGGFQLGRGTFGEAQKWKGFNEPAVTAAWRASPMRDDITRWCDSGCNYAMSIDMPLWARRAEFRETPFHECSVNTLLQLTVENLQYLEYNRGKWGNCKYLSVQQGDNPRDEATWYSGINPYHLDGWSFAGGVGIYGGGPYRMLNRLLIMRDDKLLDPGYDWLHLLMLTKFLCAPVVTAMQMGVRATANKNFTISYDSSTAYMMGGRHQKYFEPRTFTTKPDTWSNANHKFPTGYGDANEQQPIALNTVSCSANPCGMCAQGMQHLPAPLTSPIASQLYLADLLSVKDKFAKRHVRNLFDETVINHNVFTLVDATIRANEAVFDAKPHAPQQLIDAVGMIERIFHDENGNSLLVNNRVALEKAVGFKAKKHVL